MASIGFRAAWLAGKANQALARGENDEALGLYHSAIDAAVTSGRREETLLYRSIRADALLQLGRRNQAKEEYEHVYSEACYFGKVKVLNWK